ncbi:MAG: hypothetical protein ACFB03_12120 [Paracoccaceae bacterium]
MAKPTRNEILPDRPAVEAQLDRIVADPLFQRAERMTHLLRHLAEAVLTGQGETLNQYTLAQDVFGRGADFDPAIDAIVRAEVGRLRAKLREYYATSGQEDPVLILLRKRTYVPRIETRGVNPTQDRAAPVVAVLAFDNMSGDPEQSYFADGLAEDLITDLSKLPGLSLIARQSSFAYRGTPVDVRVAGAEMGRISWSRAAYAAGVKEFGSTRS